MSLMQKSLLKDVFPTKSEYKCLPIIFHWQFLTKLAIREFSSPISDQNNEELCFVDNFGSYKILKKSIKVPPAILSINYHIMINRRNYR